MDLIKDLNSTDANIQMLAAEEILGQLSELERIKKEACRNAPRIKVVLTIAKDSKEYYLTSFDAVKLKRSTDWMQRKP